MKNYPARRFPEAHRLPQKAAIVAEIRESLDKNPTAVERAMQILFDRQTESEKMAEETRESNDLGLSGAHAANVTYYAKWLCCGKHLSGTHLDKARKIAHFYAATQLFELAAYHRGLVT